MQLVVQASPATTKLGQKARILDRKKRTFEWHPASETSPVASAMPACSGSPAEASAKTGGESSIPTLQGCSSNQNMFLSAAQRLSKNPSRVRKPCHKLVAPHGLQHAR